MQLRLAPATLSSARARMSAPASIIDQPMHELSVLFKEAVSNSQLLLDVASRGGAVDTAIDTLLLFSDAPAAVSVEDRLVITALRLRVA